MAAAPKPAARPQEPVKTLDSVKGRVVKASEVKKPADAKPADAESVRALAKNFLSTVSAPRSSGEKREVGRAPRRSFEGRMPGRRNAERERKEREELPGRHLAMYGTRDAEKKAGKGVEKSVSEKAGKKSAERPERLTFAESRAPIPPFTLMPGLPVSERGDELVKAVRDNQVIIVCGETGSGKTTQLPKICLMAGRGTKGLIGHTQPRRLAASSIAKRLAEELHTPPGVVVGYKVRFTDETGPGATIKLMTDGILLAETQTDPLLKRYDTIIIDEAHERSINIDFLLGYLKRLLAKRQDLKVIVTSATIDAERFAKHFGRDADHPAPVFTISGRTYPVEIRYRPVEDVDEEDDKTGMEAIADAVEELEGAGRGDILVFLPGEREIREAAEVIRKRHRPGTLDVLPLYARLSAADQERIFSPGGVRRVVLATNVAETSLTVPGIRFVVDTGFARVKRYSYRNKVEQLLVEPVSQASANQRAGRCGRVADGICIRLYDENDWARRPAFTDPEILRSNLAAVILRMKSLKLGEVRDFPFVEPPPARAVADGYAVLGELGAIDDVGNLTEVGRQLARLPVDPKLSRMLLAANQKGALAEALVIVSGLSVQDPRERPLQAQQAADTAHKAFKDERSDFLSYIRMWQWFEKARSEKESNKKLAESIHQKFLSPRRLREWRDVYKQLLELTDDLGWKRNTVPAKYEELHQALLTGLLGNLGCRQLDGDFRAPPYLGARGIHFWLWPGSAVAKKACRWVMASELVETSRLFARCVADIEPEWVEAAAGTLIKKSWSEPHWEKKRGAVTAFERGTLYGLPVYQQRRVTFTEHDHKLAREIFIRQALVEGEFESRAAFFRHNQNLVREIRDIENKSRRPDVLVDDELIYAYYDEHIAKDVADQASFEVWLKEAQKKEPKILFLTREELMRHDAEGITTDYFPKTLRMAGTDMAVTYHFEPGAPRDGVTLAVPLFALNQIDPARCDWLVPGMVKEKVQSLLKSLPQKLRRHCVPLTDYAAGFFTRSKNGTPVAGKTLIDALIEDIAEETGIRCNREDFKTEFLAKHLVMNFKVVDEHGRQLAMGRNLAELRSELGEAAQASFRNVAEADQSVAEDLADHITAWNFGQLPELMEIERRGETLIGHPALVDRGEYCSLEVFDDPQQAQVQHRAGLRRLFMIQMKEQVKFLERNLNSLHRVQMMAGVVEPAAAGFESFEGLRDDVLNLAVEICAMGKPWPVNNVEFGARKDAARSKLSLVGQEIARTVEAVATELSAVPKKLQGAKAYPEVVKDVTNQLKRLFPKHFLLSVNEERLRHYVRYVKAINVRLDKLRNDPARDAQKMQELTQLAVPYYRELAARRGQADERLTDFGWLLEELRVSFFAQELRTPVPVSVKRLTRVWESIRRL